MLMNITVRLPIINYRLCSRYFQYLYPGLLKVFALYRREKSSSTDVGSSNRFWGHKYFYVLHINDFPINLSCASTNLFADDTTFVVNSENQAKYCSRN